MIKITHISQKLLKKYINFKIPTIIFNTKNVLIFIRKINIVTIGCFFIIYI